MHILYFMSTVVFLLVNMLCCDTINSVGLVLKFGRNLLLPCYALNMETQGIIFETFVPNYRISKCHSVKL